MRTIKVLGTGRASQSPDQIVINMSIVSQRFEYDAALRELNKRTAILKEDLQKIGFSKEDIKTTSFRVDTVYKYENNRKIFDGYKAIQDLELKFDFNKPLLNETLQVLSTTKANPNFNIVFTVKDQEAFKNKILENALLNAKSSANVIANTLDVELGDIVEVNYDFESIVYASPVMLQEASYVADSKIDIEPAEVEETQSVRVWWEIRNQY